MFYGMLVALVMLFAGSTFLDGWLREHALLFLGYWAACAWITFSAMLLAFFDLLLVRAAARRERRRLERDALGQAAPSHDENPR
ncbi:MAG: hypothetical protein JWL90_2765 [Chthoniobacteraceae bacterium]|nr:hypothetical protein [Chthoniobacteraceae bacterium]